MKKKILVIGGTGFIGKNLIDRLKKNKRFDIFSISKNKKKKLVPGVKQIFVDTTNHSLLKKKLNNKNKFNYIVNLGGYINHSSLENGGIATYSEHVKSLLNIISIVSKKDLKKFIQIGSSAEYGLRTKNVETIRENPLTFYSAGKVAATYISQMLFYNSKIPITVLRFFQVYGPGQKIDRLLPFVIKNSLKDNHFKLTKCEHVRDYCYIDDIVESILVTLKSKNTNGKIYNVGSGKGIKLKNLVNKICNLIGKGKPKFGGIPYQKIENMRLTANISEFKKELNWRPKVDLHNGLKKTIKSYS
jgi:nucleoside-diphosphate-sugar epimerase